MYAKKMSAAAVPIPRKPFGANPPRWIRAELYRYEMQPPGSDTVWRRSHVGTYLRPVSLDDPELVEFLEHFGWKERGDPGALL